MGAFFVFFGILVFFIIIIAIGSAVKEHHESKELLKPLPPPLEPVETELELPETRPPTERQLNFIDHLIIEREAEDWMLRSNPGSVESASALIEALLRRPYRKHYDDM